MSVCVYLWHVYILYEWREKEWLIFPMIWLFHILYSGPLSCLHISLQCFTTYIEHVLLKFKIINKKWIMLQLKVSQNLVVMFSKLGPLFHGRSWTAFVSYLHGHQSIHVSLHLFIQPVVVEHLLWAKHYSKHWRYIREQDRQHPYPCRAEILEGGDR